MCRCMKVLGANIRRHPTVFPDCRIYTFWVNLNNLLLCWNDILLNTNEMSLGGSDS